MSNKQQAWLPLLISVGFDEQEATAIVKEIDRNQPNRLYTAQALRIKGVGPVKLEKLRKLGIVESADEYFERTTNTWLRETAKELEDEIIKVEKWKAFAIRQADGKVARLRKKLAELKEIQPND